MSNQTDHAVTLYECDHMLAAHLEDGALCPMPPAHMINVTTQVRSDQIRSEVAAPSYLIFSYHAG